MERNRFIKSVCLIIAVVLCSGLISAAENGCDYNDAWLQAKSDVMNRVIERDVCCNQKPMKGNQKEVALHIFYEDVKPHSGKLIDKIDGKEYKYPKFRIEDGSIGYKETENTVYVLRPLPKEGQGFALVYGGISVTPYELPESTLDEEVAKINRKIAAFEATGLDKDAVKARLETFEKFSSEYSGKVLYVDERGNVYKCPRFYCAGVDILDAESYKFDYITTGLYVAGSFYVDWGDRYNSRTQPVTNNTRYKITVLNKGMLQEKDYIGLYAGIKITAYELDFYEDGYEASVGGLLETGFNGCFGNHGLGGYEHHT